MSIRLRRKWQHLTSILQDQKRMLIAFSGGCDSAFLAAAARRVLGRDAMLAVTAVSASLAAHERQVVQDFVAAFDIPHQVVQTDELNNPDYASNPTNRCFFCKDELFSRLAPLASERKMRIVDGFNASDRGDYRPGFQAAQERQVLHPLDEAGLLKQDIRILSRWMKLPTWNKPASPCLSSRIPYGTAVTAATLAQIEAAEALLQGEGFPVVRVRHFGATARIEVPSEDIARLREDSRWPRITNRLLQLGYDAVEVDPRGFKSGRLNEIVQMDSRNA
jgi:uncharacterized protein